MFAITWSNEREGAHTTGKSSWSSLQDFHMKEIVKALQVLVCRAMRELRLPKALNTKQKKALY
eukprot:6179856-Pleurochrysis_carterae.AAC.1